MTILFDCYYDTYTEMNTVCLVEENFWLKNKTLDINISKINIPDFLVELQSGIYYTCHSIEKTTKILENLGYVKTILINHEYE